MPSDVEVAAHVSAAREAAATYGGVVSRASAAATWGWDLLMLPPRPEITVPRGRRLESIDRSTVAVRRIALPSTDIAGVVTTKRRTLLDCARGLPFDSALVIFDAALRGGFPRTDLLRAAAGARGPGSIRIRLVAHHASRLAANMFESQLRAICLRVPGLDVTPQARIGTATDFLGSPDLADVGLRIVIEADSFEWHGQLPALIADARRYNGFVANGWLVLRFTWDDVMRHPDLVEETLRSAVAAARTNRDGWAS